MIIIIIFILIYLVSLMLHLVLCYKDNKRHIFYVGDLLDKIEFYMWIPVLNTLVVILFIIAIAISKLWKVSKLNVLWEKFRNIKLK